MQDGARDRRRATILQADPSNEGSSASRTPGQISAHDQQL